MDGIDLMASAMHAAKARLDVASANLANVSTDGFRRSVAASAFTSRGLVVSVQSDGAPGPLRRTGRPLDLSVAGAGSMFVRDGAGAVVAIRSASFVRDGAGNLRDEHGRALVGSQGLVHAGADATIDQDGAIHENGAITGHVRLAPGTSVAAGFLETANVNAVHEMVDVLSAQRAFETAEQTLSAIDGARSKAVNDVVRVKS
jgi:flagellar basal-body rod protein FlgG